VLIEVHADGTGDRLKTVAKTQKEAELVKTALAQKGIALDKIKARGRGSLAPVAGTRSKADKAKNRRVVLIVTPKATAQAGTPVPKPVAGLADALVAGQTAPVDEAGRFVKNVPTPKDGRLLLDLVATDGRRAFVVLQVKRGQKSLAAAPRERTVVVLGDVGTQALTVDGQPVDASLLKVEAVLQGFTSADEPSLTLAGPPRKKRGVRAPKAKPALTKPVVFELAVPTTFEASRWELSVWRAAQGSDGGGERELVYRQEAPSIPPPAVPWSGENDRGELVLRAGERYVYRLLVEDARGQRGFSPERSFTVGRGAQGGFAPISQAGTLFAKKGDPASSLKNRLSRFASAIKGRPSGELYRLMMQVYVAQGSETDRRLALAQRKGRLKAYLAKLKIPVDRVQIDALLVAASASKPERKDIVTITAIPVAKVTPIRVLVDGVDVAVVGSAFTAPAVILEGGTLLLDVTTADGHRAIWALPVLPASPPPDKGGKKPVGHRDPDGLLVPTQLGTFVPVTTGLIAQAGGGLPRQAKAEGTSERLERGPALTLSLAGDPSEFGGEELQSALEDPETAAARAEAAAKAKQERLIRDATTGQMITLPRSIRAADVVIKLPPRGLKLRSPDLWVSGKTAKGNRLRINGVEHHVQSDGSFDELVTLPLGESTLVIESVDLDDNVAMITWPVEVSRDEHFLLLLADGAMSTAYASGQGGGFTADGAALDGMSSDTTTTLGHVLLHERVALYYKGRMSGGELFSRYRITGHVDTAKRGEFQEFFQEVLDPARDYAVYGDSAEEVRDVNARGKLYVMIEADDSKLTIGNFKTNLKGGELFRYDRAVYGAEVDFKKQWGSFAQKAKAFGTLGDGRLARDVNVFRATGGSLYYLRHGQIVEGGERLRVIVRDRDNGLVLSERQMARDVDYTIDYAGGRVMFKSPIPSVADASLLIDNLDSSQTPLDGNPVYVEAIYDYALDQGLSAGAGGGYVQGTFFDTLAVGAGFLGEARDASGDLSDYTLYGADVSWKAKKRTTFRAELARSESTDAGNFLSSDGGLSFQGLDAIATTVPGAGRGGHLAWKLELESQLGDFASAEWAESTSVRLYAQDLDRGFSSGGTILEQGRTKFGGQATYKLSDRDTLTVRYDGERAELPRIGPQAGNVAKGLETLDERLSQRATAAWARSGKRTDLRIEAAYHGVSSSAQLGDGSPQVDTDRVGVAGQLGYRLSKRLVLRAGQEFVATLSELDPTLMSVVRFQKTDDLADPLAGIATTLGVDWEMAKDLHVSTGVALRWNGDTALLAGLKTPLDGNASMYMSERLEDRDGRLVSTSIVGGEQKFGSSQGGKAYGEYQLESGVLGARNRAVMGLGHRFAVRPGWNVAAGFEHQQTFGGFLPDGTPTGQNQRDVVHVGTEYLKRDTLKASASVEVRFDDGMHGQPTSVPHSFEPLVKSDPRLVAPPGTYPDHGGTAPGAPLILVPGEKLQLVAGAAGDWIWNRDLTFLGRFQLGQTWDITDRHTEGATQPAFTAARFLRATAGWAYRPLKIDWLDVLLQYSYLLDMRPIALAGGSLENRSHVVSLAPVVLLPMRLQLSGKVAWKHTGSEAELIEDQVLSGTVDLLLWLTRVSYRFYGKWDVAGEYRHLALFKPGDTSEQKQGFLAEVDYVLSDRIRLGLGYNFSHFSDDELSDLTRDTHGFFFRVVGRY
jgi:hypothetical protein